jgi:hypothetical protein
MSDKPMFSFHVQGSDRPIQVAADAYEVVDDHTIALTKGGEVVAIIPSSVTGMVERAVMEGTMIDDSTFVPDLYCSAGHKINRADLDRTPLRKDCGCPALALEPVL